jgi:beta-galactosidase/beta-glucuronidase
MDIPRAEYPRPQFVRDQWQCLNGPWQFEIDQSDSGIHRGLLDRELAQTILVPFAPESAASGIGNGDHLNAVWYRREITIPAEWAGKRALLHFQAVSQDAVVWVNGKEVYRHRGCWSPFTVDLGDYTQPGETFTLVVRARHDTRKLGAYGKQMMGFSATPGDSYCWRVTGIWQSVWMEPVADVHLKRSRITPNVARKRFEITQPISQNRRGLQFRATLFWDGRELAHVQVPADQDFSPSVELPVPDEELHLWGPGEGNLYDITLELIDADGTVVDCAQSYAGLRSVSIDGMAVRINGKNVFQRLVLDQGLYLDTAQTAPSDEILRKDIELSMAAGFNGARFHQKVFEERSMYHADRMGYLVWGEMGDWGYDLNAPPMNMISQWLEVMERDYSHPCIVGWCALNESAAEIRDEIDALEDFTRALFLAAKAMDPSRPVLDASGYSHRMHETDIWDTHEYDFKGEMDKWAAMFEGMETGKVYVHKPSWCAIPVSVDYHGQPYFVSEFGGLWWAPRDRDADESWGYGPRPDTEEEFLELMKFYFDTLLDNPHMFGYCFTQLTDTMPEQNGVVYQDRSLKYDLGKLKAIQSRPAAFEMLD